MSVHDNYLFLQHNRTIKNVSYLVCLAGKSYQSLLKYCPWFLSCCTFFNTLSAYGEGTFQAVSFPSLSLCKYSQHRVSGGMWCTRPGKKPLLTVEFHRERCVCGHSPSQPILNCSPPDRPRMTLPPHFRRVWTEADV